MAKIKLTITESCCRSCYHKAGDEFIVEDICPPICRELWHRAYLYIFALQNGARLDKGDTKAKCFDVICPDGGRVHLHGEVVEE